MAPFRGLIRSIRSGSQIIPRAGEGIVAFITDTTTLSIVGLFLIAYGVHLAWHPGGYIVFGSGLLAEGVWQAIEEARNERIPRKSDSWQ